MVLIPLIFNYGINTNAMEIARFALSEWRARWSDGTRRELRQGRLREGYGRKAECGVTEMGR